MRLALVAMLSLATSACATDERGSPQPAQPGPVGTERRTAPTPGDGTCNQARLQAEYWCQGPGSRMGTSGGYNCSRANAEAAKQCAGK